MFVSCPRQKITPTAESGYSCMMARAQYNEESEMVWLGNRPRASSAVKRRGAPRRYSVSVKISLIKLQFVRL